MAEIQDATVRNPYPGLRPFRLDEKHLFFGREQQVDRMVGKLAARRFLAVVGGSGSGKSSLVNCGLRPALHRGNMAEAGAAWRMTTMRPGTDPIGALARALAVPGLLFDAPQSDALPTEVLVEDTLRLGSLGVVDIVDQADLPQGTNLLVVADQFEELFRFHDMMLGGRTDSAAAAKDAVSFVRLLLEAAEQTEVPIYVVLTMRSDFLGDCAKFQGLPEAMNESQYLVPRLTRSEIRAAITGPAAVAGAELGPVLVTHLLNDVGDNQDQLSILQHALNRTWYKWETEGQGIGPLELAHYRSAGGMDRALHLHAEKAFSEFTDEPGQWLCKRIFKALTDAGTDARGTRRPTRMDTLGAITGSSPEQLEAAIGVFRKPSRSFLMPPMTETLGPNSAIDISHESLMRVWGRLRQWTVEEAESARVYRRLRETAVEHERGHANLLRDPELQVALDWRDENMPTEAWAELYGGGFTMAIDFLTRSLDQQEQEKRAAAIDLRWQSTWSWVPLVVSALAFFGLQVLLGTELDTVVETWPAAHLDSDVWVVSKLASMLAALEQTRWLREALTHLLAGMPAAVAYMVLSPFVRQRFPRWEERWHVRVGVDTRSHADVQAQGYAKFRARALAQVIDGLLYLVLLRGTTLVLGADLGLVVFVMFVGIYAYNVWCWISSHQATLGMRMAGVFLTDRQGRPLTWLRATGRFFARWLSYYTAGIGFLVQPFNRERQTLHDRVVRSVVLRRTPERTRPAGDAVRYAGFWRRAMAGAVDFIACTFVMGAVLVPLAMFTGVYSYALTIVVVVVLLFAYQVLCWIAAPQSTFGMMLADIYVANLDQKRLTSKRAVGRFFARWLSLVTIVGLLMQLLTGRRQALHDRMCGTVVLRGEPGAVGAPANTAPTRRAGEQTFSEAPGSLVDA